MHSVRRRVLAERVARSQTHIRPAGFVEVAIVSLLGLALTLFLIGRDLFPALPIFTG